MTQAVKLPGPDHPITIAPHLAHVVVSAGGQVLADTRDALALQEASYPAILYIPRADVDLTRLERTDHSTHCPYKGDASYYSIPGVPQGANSVWTYEAPHDAVAPIKDHLAFYPNRVEIEERPQQAGRQHLYWETCGNPAGRPAVVLHGGPGSGAGRHWTGLLDPAAYRIVLVDQRGCGRSVPDVADPAVPLDAHTTHHVVADLEHLRAHLGIRRWLVLGASQGSTLGLAYAQRHPHAVVAAVLFSVCGTTRREVEWVTRGMRRYLPEEWERFRDGVAPADRDGDLVSAYARLLADPDPAARERAARDWCAWEERHVTATTGRRVDPRYADPAFRMRFARLVTHCWRHAAWLGDDELVAGAARLAGVPGVLVHGRADLSSPPEFAWRVHRAWPGSELVLVDGAGHGADDAMTEAVVAATDRFR